MLRLRRRSWPEITTELLEATLTPLNKMRIMYKANLNFERFNRYFHELLRKGFLEATNDGSDRVVYQTTPRGRELLETLRKAHALLFADES